jgi:hypothetical protein
VVLHYQPRALFAIGVRELELFSEQLKTDFRPGDRMRPATNQQRLGQAALVRASKSEARAPFNILARVAGCDRKRVQA